MWQDISDLRAFYASPLGEFAQRSIARRLRAFWPDLSGMRVLALGYGPPFLEPALREAERTVAAMPALQGGARWPAAGPSRALLAEDTALPLADNLFDRVLLVHAIESSERLRPMLREVWRVTAEGGRIAAVAPNRRGVWARIEGTPFGHGRPFSQSQLTRLLRDHMFSPRRIEFALHAPPSRRRLAAAWERLGARWMRPFGGAVLCEAEKEAFAAIPLAVDARRAPAAAPFRPAAAARATA